MRRVPAIVLLLLVAACNRDTAEIEKAVRAYDDGLVLAYRTGKAEPLAAHATDKEWGRVQVLADLKSGSKLMLDATIESFKVTSAAWAENSATVETRERWRYFDRPLDPGKPLGDRFVADMTMRYTLNRVDGKWKVASVVTLTNDFLEPKGFKPVRAHEQGRAHGQGPGHGAGDGHDAADGHGHDAGESNGKGAPAATGAAPAR